MYFPTIGNAKTQAQTGFADWFQDFPNPSDYYLLLDAKSIQPVNNENFSNVNDPKIQASLAKLNPVPATELTRVASQWEELDRYAARRPTSSSTAREQSAVLLDADGLRLAVFHPVYFTDWSTRCS